MNVTGFQNPYLNPYGFQQPQMPVFAQPQKQVDKVNGRNGALQYPIGANSSAWILDESGSISWLIMTDSAGYKTVTPYDVAPHKETPAPDYGTIENRIARLEEIINGNTANSSATGKKQSAASSPTNKANDEHGSFRTEPATHAEPTRNEQSPIEAGNGYSQQTWGRSGESLSGNGAASGY